MEEKSQWSIKPPTQKTRSSSSGAELLTGHVRPLEASDHWFLRRHFRRNKGDAFRALVGLIRARPQCSCCQIGVSCLSATLCATKQLNGVLRQVVQSFIFQPGGQPIANIICAASCVASAWAVARNYLIPLIDFPVRLSLLAVLQYASKFETS